jgi:hypothetical protein
VVDEGRAPLPHAQALLGYLNLSDGRPDPRWQRQLDDAFAHLAAAGFTRPWEALLVSLRSELADLHTAGGAAFRDTTQAAAALALCADTLPAYRRHHADLLGHLDEADLFAPFFLARTLEAVLHQLSAGNAPSPDGLVRTLNDFAGHRPVAILETRPQGEAYPHEKHRPLPVWMRGAGFATGRHRAVLEAAFAILQDTDTALLTEASFSFGQLEEVAIDLRAYDHGHPANRRPNYVFGEWDPHCIDGQGRYARYVVRSVTLDALMDRVENARDIAPPERLHEGAAVLAGTVLMAAGVSGWGPGAHDSATSLAALLPRIARYRDRFYERLLERLSGPHGDRLRRERETTRQPFGGARQHLNAFLARHRAAQLQQRQLAVLFADMGYPAASRAEAGRIKTVSVRMLGELLGQAAAGQADCDHGRLQQAAARLPAAEGLLHRGIDCGALADPWNVLGFQGLFPLSSSREDAIRDPRIDELIQAVEQIFTLYARVMGEATAAGDTALSARLHAEMERLAAWWDQFATSEVSDVRRLNGAEAVRSAANVAQALGAWRQRGEAVSDLAFWRERLDEFGTPKAFAQVVEALLARSGHRAALGLLASWLSRADEVPLEDGPHSFHNLALRWMLSLARPDAPESDAALAVKFFDYLEANAEGYWEVPSLEEGETRSSEDEDQPFEAAYEGMVYRDSTEGDEGAVSDGAPADHFDLEEQAEPLQARLRFLATLARLWQITARFLAARRQTEPLDSWLTTARNNQRRLLALLDALGLHSLPEPSGDYDSLVEYDRRRVMKEQLIYATIATCLDTALAVAGLRGAMGDATGGKRATTTSWYPETPPDPRFAPGWEAAGIELERALFAGDVDAARSQLARFTTHFRGEPLLFTPLAEGPEGGEPRAILRVRINQAVLRSLLANMPRLGLLRDTYELLRTARAMEQSQPTRGRGVTEFNHFFQSAYQSAVESVVRSSRRWPADQGTDHVIVELLERLTAPFLALWIEHSRTLQLSVLEGVGGEQEWQALTAFIQRFGRDLFHARFLTLGNLRGILHRGVGAYLDYLQENGDPLRPVRLIEELGAGIRREDAVKRLELVLQAVVENYEEFKDYNTTTTQSDYGENLHVLLDFLRLKTAYERYAWQFRPLVLAHEVLARHGSPSTALRWEQSLTQFTRELSKQHQENLTRLERRHGIRLGTVSDRIGERFVKPLALDRLCALIEPCVNEARQVEDEAARPAFRRLQEELRTYAASPSGVGLDVPAWLRRLETELHRVQAQKTAVAVLAEAFFRVPRRDLTLEEVQAQLRDWERPALPR